jgi:hypothetical protein
MPSSFFFNVYCKPKRRHGAAYFLDIDLQEPLAGEKPWDLPEAQPTISITGGGGTWSNICTARVSISKHVYDANQAINYKWQRMVSPLLIDGETSRGGGCLATRNDVARNPRLRPEKVQPRRREK